MYKPGQIITIQNVGQYRVVKAKAGQLHCMRCDLDPHLQTCSKYCYRKLGNNDFNKYPLGYIFKKIRSLCGKQDSV